MLCGRTRSMTCNFTATDTLGLTGDSPGIIKTQHHPQGLADVCWRSAGTKNWRCVRSLPFCAQGPNRRLRAQGRLEHVVPGARVVERIAVHSFCEAVYAERAKLSFNFHGQFQL